MNDSNTRLDHSEPLAIFYSNPRICDCLHGFAAPIPRAFLSGPILSDFLASIFLPIGLVRHRNFCFLFSAFLFLCHHIFSLIQPNSAQFSSIQPNSAQN
jgi:hypothetical protein